MGEGVDDLGFAPAYRVEVGPEYPGDGSWGCPVFGFDHPGGLGAPFESQWGTVTVVRVQPGGADE